MGVVWLKAALNLLPWVALYYSTHLLSLRLVVPEHYALRSAGHRNLWCQYVNSMLKGTIVFLWALPIAWANRSAFLAAKSFDGAIVGTDMEGLLYLYVGYAANDLGAIIAYYNRKGGDALLNQQKPIRRR